MKILSKIIPILLCVSFAFPSYGGEDRPYFSKKVITRKIRTFIQYVQKRDQLPYHSTAAPDYMADELGASIAALDTADYNEVLTVLMSYYQDQSESRPAVELLINWVHQHVAEELKAQDPKFRADDVLSSITYTFAAIYAVALMRGISKSFRSIPRFHDVSEMVRESIPSRKMRLIIGASGTTALAFGQWVWRNWSDRKQDPQKLLQETQAAVNRRDPSILSHIEGIVVMIRNQVRTWTAMTDQELLANPYLIEQMTDFAQVLNKAQDEMGHFAKSAPELSYRMAPTSSDMEEAVNGMEKIALRVGWQAPEGTTAP